jgi:large subunit ribosomal protein L17
MLSNMASSLILHKRITTTVAKAKALRKYVEPLITRAKDDTTQSRRVVFSYLQDKDSVKELFGDIAGRVAARPGGYTRIIKTNTRLGDNADMCIMELVDYNEFLLKEAAPAKPKTRRSRRGGGSKSTEEKATPVVEEAVVVEEEVADAAADTEETTSEEATEAKADDATENKSEEAKDEESDDKKDS